MDDEPALRRELEQYYRAHYKPLLRYASKLVHDHHVAEEIVQESYVKLHAALERGEVKDVKPWLYVVTHNAAMDYFRMRRREPFTLPPNSTARCVAQELEDDDEDEGWRKYLPHLGQALDALPAERALLLREHYFSGLPYQELATQRGKNEAAMKVAAFRARRSLKVALESLVKSQEVGR